MNLFAEKKGSLAKDLEFFFFLPANAQLGDQCPRIDAITKEHRHYSCVALAQAVCDHVYQKFSQGDI